MIESAPNPRLAQVLTYAGTLPLIGCALMAWTRTPPGVDAAAVGIAYGAVIASFISGIHWAASLFFHPRCGQLPLIVSNVIALLAWVSVLLGNVWGCLLLALCFVSLLALDRRLHAQAVLPTWFYRLRRSATVIVVSMLLLLAFA